MSVARAPRRPSTQRMALWAEWPPSAAEGRLGPENKGTWRARRFQTRAHCCRLRVSAAWGPTRAELATDGALTSEGLHGRIA